MKFAVVIDSTLEVSEELSHLVHVVPLRITLKDLELEDGDRDLKWLFETMREKRCFAKTSQPSPNRFRVLYEKLLREYDWILSIHISSKLSGTIQSAAIASKEFGDRVRMFDTKSASIVGQVYVKRALEMKDRDPDTILRELKRIRDEAKFFLTVRDLEYLKRSGRLGGVEAVIGSVLKLKPMIEVVEGELKIAKIVVGRNKAMSFMKKQMEKMRDRKVLIGYILDRKPAEELSAHAKNLGMEYEVIPVKSLTLSIHLGPGGYGIFLYHY